MVILLSFFKWQKHTDIIWNKLAILDKVEDTLHSL